jgi:predicted  nucleic acid-binding Zn-ribbon protein
MMQVQEIFDKLRSLQSILSEKYQVETEIEDIPKILATKMELLNRLKKSYIQKNSDLDAMKEKIKDTKRKMNEAEREREQYEKQMDLIKTQREYEALDKQIKDATEKEQEFRRELQNEEQGLDEMQVSLEKEEVLISKQEEEVKSEQARIKHEVKEKNKFLSKLEKEESKINPGLDEELLFKFERIIKSKSGLGIVPVVDGVCAGCHMILPPQYVNDVRMGTDIGFCPHCSRILYFQEETSPSFDAAFFQEEQARAPEAGNETQVEEVEEGAEAEEQLVEDSSESESDES